MDRPWASTSGNGQQGRRSAAEGRSEDEGEGPALPSRDEAMAAMRAAIEAQAGPVLLTGEAGVGKTWLWRRLLAGMPIGWRSLVVDVPPAIDASALYPLIGHRLGLPDRGHDGRARLAVADSLREAAADGIRWTLVLDEAHNGSAHLLEEARLLANRLGQADGFSALILVGQTSMARQLATRPLEAIAARLSAHVHLRGLDVDEARMLLRGMVPGLDLDDLTLERLHRDASGNPRRLLMTARLASDGPPRVPRERPDADPSPGRPRTSPAEAPRLAPVPVPHVKDGWDTSVIGPVKPPLRVGEGMIEVGWEPEADSEVEVDAAAGPLGEPAPGTVPGLVVASGAKASAGAAGATPVVEVEGEAVVAIEDHYASLQAWNEWSRNQGRAASEMSADGRPSSAWARPDLPAGSPSTDPAAGTAPPPGVWIESQQAFAPYSQLFSRLKHAQDASGSS